jgi:hypothetical protein
MMLGLLAAVITSWQIATTQCHPSWLGVQAFDPDNAPTTWALQSNLQPAYVNLALDCGPILTGDWTRADALVAANSGYKIVLEIGGTSNTVSNAVAAIVGRYTNTIYAVQPLNEPSDDVGGQTNFARYFNQARGALAASGWGGTVLMAAPCLDHSTISNFMSGLTNLIGGITNVGVVSAHNYRAAPGGGGAPTNGQTSYIHPIDGEDGGPNLADQLVEMNRWQALTGHTNTMPVIAEYGLYWGDVQDAIDAAEAFKTNHCVCIFDGAVGFINEPIPISHQLPGGLWSKAMTEFLRKTCQ